MLVLPASQIETPPPAPTTEAPEIGGPSPATDLLQILAIACCACVLLVVLTIVLVGVVRRRRRNDDIEWYSLVPYVAEEAESAAHVARLAAQLINSVSLVGVAWLRQCTPYLVLRLTADPRTGEASYYLAAQPERIRQLRAAITSVWQHASLGGANPTPEPVDMAEILGDGVEEIPGLRLRKSSSIVQVLGSHDRGAENVEVQDQIVRALNTCRGRTWTDIVVRPCPEVWTDIVHCLRRASGRNATSVTGHEHRDAAAISRGRLALVEILLYAENGEDLEALEAAFGSVLGPNQLRRYLVGQMLPQDATDRIYPVPHHPATPVLTNTMSAQELAILIALPTMAAATAAMTRSAVPQFSAPSELQLTGPTRRLMDL